MNTASPQYDKSYFNMRNNKTFISAKKILGLLEDVYLGKQVIDIGCGVGTWSSVAKNNGAKSVIAIDGPWVDKDLLQIGETEFVQHDLSLGSPGLEENYSLAIWLENAEHLPEGVGENIQDWICQHADFVLFSAAIPGQGGIGHVNEQWQSYWAKRYHDNGFAAFDVLRNEIWSDEDVPYWYKQNMILYVRENYVCNLIMNESCVTDFRKLDVVHPDKWEKEINKKIGVKQSIGILVSAMKSKFFGK